MAGKEEYNPPIGTIVLLEVVSDFVLKNSEALGRTGVVKSKDIKKVSIRLENGIAGRIRTEVKKLLGTLTEPIDDTLLVVLVDMLSVLEINNEALQIVKDSHAMMQKQDVLSPGTQLVYDRLALFVTAHSKISSFDFNGTESGNCTTSQGRQAITERASRMHKAASLSAQLELVRTSLSSSSISISSLLAIREVLLSAKGMFR